MTNLLDIENENSYKKDAFSAALINTDTNLLAERKYRMKMNATIKELQNEINILKEEISFLKQRMSK